MEIHRKTEATLDQYSGLDTWPDDRILDALLEGQERSIAAVRDAIPAIAQAANAIARCVAGGGRLVYAGAGTPIRIAVQDGSELPATFGMKEENILYLIAGGRDAMFETLAAAEDDAENGRTQARACSLNDIVVAVSASGSTAFTVAAARQAKENGSTVIAVVNNPGSELALVADIEILLNSGPEVIAGSTRLGAGTAQKAALNLLSTLAHIRLGAVHDGMMVNVQADNAKLRRRAAAIVARITNVDENVAAAALATSGGHVKEAVLICAGAASIAAAKSLLHGTNGNLRMALQMLRDI